MPETRIDHAKDLDADDPKRQNEESKREEAVNETGYQEGHRNTSDERTRKIVEGDLDEGEPEKDVPRP